MIEDKIHSYFIAERQESLLFIAIGAITLLLSFYFWIFINAKFYNGVGWPFFFVAIIQLVVGVIVFLRSPSDEKRVRAFMENNSKNIKALEIPRMEKVMKNFVVYRYVEMGLLVSGLLLFLFGFEGGFQRGLGMGLIIQAGLMLLADSFAEQRGRIYLDYLKHTFGTL